MSNFKWLFSCLFVAASISGTSQILITKPGDTVMQKSAMLEVKSNERGFLPPRMSSQERRAIASPAAGLMVYDTSKQKMYVYTTAGWKSLMYEVTDVNYNALSQITKPATLNSGGLFGFTVDLEGDYALIGAPTNSIGGEQRRGTVYCYYFDGDEWLKSQELTSPDGKAGDNFGQNVLIHGSFAFIGAPFADNGENADDGSVYVYQRVNNQWTYFSKLVGGSSSNGDLFGIDIAASGNTLAIGASSDDIGVNENQGSVYMFEWNGAAWIQTQKLYTLSGGNSEDYFGGRVHLQDSLLFVGNEYSPSYYGLCQNAVYVYAKNGATWTQQAKIVAPDPVDIYEAFGYSIWTAGQKLMVGAVFHNNPYSNKDRGAVYEFERTDTLSYTWNYVQKLSPTDSYVNDIYGDYFGNYLSGDGDIMLASSHYEDVNGSINQGAVYRYKLSNGSWAIQSPVLTKTGFVTDDRFGYATATSGGWVIVSAPGRLQNTGEVFFIKL